jgi:hypothetical protein
MNTRNLKIASGTVIFCIVLGFMYWYNWNLIQNGKNDSGFDQKDFEGIFIFGTDIMFTEQNFTNNELENQLNDSWYLRIYGNVIREYYIGISTLLNSSNFLYLERVPIQFLNSWGTIWNRDFSGVPLDDIFQKLDSFQPSATMLRFEAIDNYISFNLPIKTVIDNPNCTMIADKERGFPLLSQNLGGDGPLKSIVKLDILQNDPEISQIYAANGQTTIYNSQYAVKYCTAIKIL